MPGPIVSAESFNPFAPPSSQPDLSRVTSEAALDAYLRRTERLEATTGESWSEPESLGGKLPTVEAIKPEFLPTCLRSMAEDVAERMQVPLDFPAVVSVATLAGLAGRRAFIQPKRHDSSWKVVPNLWGGLVSEPGAMKSPVISLITAPAKELEREWRREDAVAMQHYARSTEESELAVQAWRAAASKAHKSGHALPSRPGDAPEPPAERRLITQDATFASLHKILAANPGGLFVLRDELTGWLASLEERGRESERAFYLEAWNGDSPYTVDRIERGSIAVDHTCVSLFGGIQPSRLRHYLADVLQGGPANDGLMQRFQLLVWPDAVASKWEYIDRRPDEAARLKACEMYRRVASMDPLTPAHYRFDDQAQQLFVEWLTDLERRVASPQTGEVMRAHLAKYRSLMPSLALLFALADGATCRCSLVHAQLAAGWCDYLETHALRVYSARASAAQTAASILAAKLASGFFPSLTFSLRDVYRCAWTGLSTKEEAKAALRVLEDAGWVRSLPEAERKPGRKPSENYSINPLLEAHHAGC